ncbi:putative ABC transport system permease protein [Gracilibacillus halotolerans]|uniref:Putative ABC transport system permease protein n=1 Tax=Gracilibacillus halotolerans TaxID=74386 RepID=A0A841RJC4_9BACI|nr:iron export ABC transporter permease subunit FetB [Gracilibacillus halotolerans]MBB6511967.1 putative ABC transport system permease protein [Gracilibacillus halotolerans]
MNEMLDITLIQLISAYLFIVILLIIVRLRKIPREKEIVISTFRMTIQLVLVGYVLTYIFENEQWYYSVIILIIMETFAIYNIFKRSKHPLNRELKKIIAVSMVAGTLFAFLYFDFVVVQFSPWYDPRYFIPIAGMLIGNSMTGITLGVSSLMEGFSSRKKEVEAALMLGATPNKASQKLVNHAFDSAILPTINNMVGMGIVFLPGMMTGVILSGASPLSAIKYQIAIMLGITGSVALSVILFLYFGYKTFFNKSAQLNI